MIGLAGEIRRQAGPAIAELARGSDGDAVTLEHFGDRLAGADFVIAAGFGEFQPIDQGSSDEAFSHNRRIELKLTER